MSMSAAQQPSNSGADSTVLAIILATSMGHFLNDMMQSLLPAIYPMLKDNYSLSFWQIGLLTFTFQMTASILQPLVGIYTDRKPMPYSLPFGMGCTLVGLVFLATAHHYSILLLGAAFVGFGSSVFHPEAARVARLPPAVVMASRNPCFRWAAISARRLVPFWQRSLFCLSARSACRGSLLPP